MAAITRGIKHLLAVALLIPAAISAQQHFPAAADLEAMLRYIVEDGETPGVVLGVLEADGSTRIVSYGSPGAGARPLGPRSVFEMGSVTKTFTGTLLADMLAGGEVALEDPVSKYLPSAVKVPAFGDRQITLLDLVTHTSGIEDAAVLRFLTERGHTPSDPLNPWADYTVELLYSWLSEHELAREPGTEYEYSNLGMGLLAHALARVAGTTVRELMAQRILEPLGMGMTSYGLGGEVEQQMVRGHEGDGVVPYWFATDAAEGAGGLRSTAEDMLVFLAANIGDPQTELEQAMRSAHEPRRPMGDGDARIGFAWRSYTLNGRPLVWHGGRTGGFRTVIVFDPERRVGVVVLSNSTDFGDNIATDLAVHAPPPSISEVTVSPGALAAHAGEYRSAPGLTLYVRAEDEGYLTVQTPNDVRIQLYALSDSSFIAKREEWSLTFQRGENGESEEIALEINGRTNRFVRVGDEVPSSQAVAGNVPMSDEEMAPYEGTYDLDGGDRTLEYRVFAGDGRLMSHLGRTDSRLIPMGNDEFIVVRSPNIRVVFTLEDGRAVRVTLVVGDRRDSGVRRR